MGVEADGLVVVLWPAGSGVVGVGMIRVQTNDLVVVLYELCVLASYSHCRPRNGKGDGQEHYVGDEA